VSGETGGRIVLASSGLEVPAVGAALLGVFIGYLAWYFIVRFAQDAYTSDGLVAVLGVIAGGVVVEFLKGGSLSARDWWWYPIGLVIGWAVFCVFHFVNWLATRKQDPKKKPLPALIAVQEEKPRSARR
jgi:hypothetical protein